MAERTRAEFNLLIFLRNCGYTTLVEADSECFLKSVWGGQEIPVSALSGHTIKSFMQIAQERWGIARLTDVQLSSLLKAWRIVEGD